MSLTIIGLEKLSSNLQEYILKTNAKADIVLRDIGNRILKESRDEAPIDTSTLIKSAKSEETGNLERTISYNTPYAARLHEHPEYKFQKGRKGKFLEDPVKREVIKMAREIQKFIKI